MSPGPNCSSEPHSSPPEPATRKPSTHNHDTATNNDRSPSKHPPTSGPTPTRSFDGQVNPAPLDSEQKRCDRGSARARPDRGRGGAIECRTDRRMQRARCLHCGPSSWPTCARTGGPQSQGFLRRRRPVGMAARRWRERHRYRTSRFASVSAAVFRNRQTRCRTSAGSPTPTRSCRAATRRSSQPG
jgi:hypothetical protein